MSAQEPGQVRRFLFLQGMANLFFARLGQALAERGHDVRRINFNGGDRAVWRLPGAADFGGSLKDWPDYLRARLDAWGVTDIILFGDCRPLHEAAIALAVPRGVAVHVFEEGYVRPNHVTLEAGGVNGRSSMPRDVDWFLENAVGLPPFEGGQAVSSSFLERALYDVLYTAATVALFPLYPGYRTHRPWNPLWEYVGWVPRLARQRLRRRRNLDLAEEIIAAPWAYHLLPLQLDCDTQIRRHSGFCGIREVIDTIVGSFASHAAPDARLVVKEHPMDNGLTDWQACLWRAARAAGVADRVLYIESGPIEPLIARAQSVITVNSTTGMLALAQGKPLVALGDAIYDLPGLTFQGELADFWTRAADPDMAAFDAFRRVVVDRTQVNGGFFGVAGVALAVAESVRRMEGAGLAPQGLHRAQQMVERGRGGRFVEEGSVGLELVTPQAAHRRG